MKPTDAGKWQLGELCFMKFIWMWQKSNMKNNSVAAVHHHAPTDWVIEQSAYDEDDE